jgi:hypothetical protein
MEGTHHQRTGCEVGNRKTIVVPELELLIGLNKGGKKWTREEEDVLSTYYPKGVPMSAIAKHLKRSTASVEHKIRAMGLSR